MKTYLDMDEILRHCRRYIGQEYDEPYLVSAVPEEVIRSLPPADVVERKTATWQFPHLEPDDVTGHVYAECSNCHKVRIVDDFCPACGSRMVESEISKVISADVVKRKRGKWERDKHNGLLYCPFCDSVAPSKDQYGETIYRPPFCHQCGADLREADNG